MSLKEYLVQRRLSYADFAALLEVTPQFIGMVARGQRKPRWELALKIEKLTLGEVSRNQWYDDSEGYVR